MIILKCDRCGVSDYDTPRSFKVVENVPHHSYKMAENRAPWAGLYVDSDGNFTSGRFETLHLCQKCYNACWEAFAEKLFDTE